MKMLFYFLIIPATFVITRIHLIGSINEVISYIVFIMINFIISIFLYHRLSGKEWTNRKLISYIASYVLFDQILKIMVSWCDLEINIIKQLWCIKPTKNLHQTAGLHILDIELNTTLIIAFKLIVIFVILGMYILYKNKTTYVVCAFILLISAGIATFIDSACWGYTLDYIYFYHLTCYDLKDFYVDTALGFMIIEQSKTFFGNNSKLIKIEI